MTFNNNTKSSERDFFSGEYQFTGKHGEYVKQLTDTLVEKGTYEKEIKIYFHSMLRSFRFAGLKKCENSNKT